MALPVTRYVAGKMSYFDSEKDGSEDDNLDCDVQLMADRDGVHDKPETLASL